MKITVGLIFFIIYGILSFSDAADHDLAQLCSKYGGSKAYADLVSSEKKMETCFEPVLKDLTNEYNKSNGGVDSTIALVCKKVEDDSIKNCIQGFTNSLKICNDKDVQDGIDIIFKTVISLSKFSCENTELLKKALTSKDLKCASTQLKTLQNCSVDLVTPASRSTTRSQLMAPSTDVSDVISSVKSSFDSKHCNELLIAEQCAVNVLKQCQDKVFSEILDKLFKYVNNDIPKCKDLPRSQRRSDASPTSVVNVMILLISVITMSF